MIVQDPLQLMEKLEKKTARVAVVGMGYVGLPLALAFNRAGYPVLGFDVDPKKVERLEQGESYLKHIASERLAEARKTGRFEASNELEALRLCDAVVIAVPTPLTRMREPDMSFVVGSTEAVASVLRPGQLVVLESTTWPGTTVEIMKPILERRGFKCGVDFFLAYSPEREDPGNPSFETSTIPKLVGGVTDQCLAHALALYEGSIEKVIAVSSTEVAELAKLFENIFRCVNIALVNELKQLCHRMEVDVHEVIDAAATKPFGFMPFHPGPGLGGHCIPIDPFYLTWKAREYEFSTRFIELAGEINTGMPHYVVHRTLEALSRRGQALKGARILVLGLAYKKNVDDVRESPSMRVIELLEEQGAEVIVHDPYVPKTHRMRKHDLQYESMPLSDGLLERVHCALILTDHDSVDYAKVAAKVPLVIDTRNATKGLKPRAEIVHA